LEVLGVDIKEEPTGGTGLFAADGIAETGGGVGEETLLPGTGDGHVEESALLFEVTYRFGSKGVGEEAFFKSGDEDVFKLQSFGGVDGHEGDMGGGVVRIGVLIGEEGYVGEVVGQKDGFGVFRTPRLDKLGDGTEKLLRVFEAADTLIGMVVAELGEETGVLGDVVGYVFGTVL
jgi:hypothetical protein